jgi:hypothetical protein
MVRSVGPAFLLAVIAPWVLAQEQQTIQCGAGSLCPEEFPCCSREYTGIPAAQFLVRKLTLD